MKTILKLIKKHRVIVSYLFWGVMTTLVSWGTYSLFVFALNSIFLANVISWICAVLFAFITNKMWVFNSTSWSLQIVFAEAWKFLTSRLLTGLLEIFGVPLLVSAGLNQTILGIQGMVAKVIISIAVIILNYILSKWLVFGKKTTAITS